MSVIQVSYLARFCAVLAAVVLLAWAYVLALPLAFLPGGYPYWTAKSELLQTCQTGRITFFGDSRVESGIIPAMLPVAASNIGVAAGTPVEVDSAVRRALACPAVPGQAVIALSAEHFGPLSQFFWNGTLKYGFLSLAELWDAKHLARTLGDTAAFTESREPADFPVSVRDWMYGIRFPSIYFSSLVQGRVFARLAENRARLAGALRDRGYFDHSVGEGAREPPYADFRLQPVQAALFERTLHALADRGVAVGLLVMPVSPNGQPAAAVEQHYREYLQSVAGRIPGVSLIGGGRMPHWPQRLFGDDYHLTLTGARAMSERLAGCMADGRVRSECDLDWHEKDVTQAK